MTPNGIPDGLLSGVQRFIFLPIIVQQDGRFTLAATARAPAEAALFLQ